MTRAQLQVIIMNETTSLRWRAHAAKQVVNYNSVNHNDDEEHDEDDKNRLSANKNSNKNRTSCCCGARVVDGIAATAVASSMISWMTTNHALVRISCASTFFFGPFAAYQTRKLQDLEALRKHQNRLREEINYLHQQEERLYRSLEKCDANILKMERVERQLNRIAGGSHNVHRMLLVVQEQRQVYRGIKESLRKSVLQSILTALVKSDQDGNFMIQSREMQVLIVRLNMMQGVQFNETMFREVIEAESQSLSSIMRLIRSLLRDDDETVFVLCPEELTK